MISGSGKMYERMESSGEVGDCVLFFFKQKTAYEIVSRDWSSDVCSSDLKDASKIFFLA